MLNLISQTKTKTMEKIIEADILIALFKATTEQKTMLKGTLSKKFKMLFNQWEAQGNRLMQEFEGKDVTIDEHLEQIADVLHDTVDEIRKQITFVYDLLRNEIKYIRCYKPFLK